VYVGGDIHASAALPSGKEHPILVDREFGWAPRAGLNVLEKGMRFLCYLAGIVRTIPITLLRLLVNCILLCKRPLYIIFASFSLVPNVFL